MKSTSMILSAALAACAFIAFGSAVTPPDQPVLVDTSASAGSVVESSVSATAYPATKAFDGAWNTIGSDRWLAYINPNKSDYTGGLTGETPAYVTYKFNTATRVNTLRIRIPSDKDYACSDRAPKAWTFSGSNNGSDWVTLDTRSGITWASGTTTKTFAFENETKYEYYKFSCSEIGGTNDYLQIYELQFLYDAGIVLTDLTTTTSGSVSSASGTHGSYPASKAFDGNKSDTNGRWLCTFNSTMYLVYHFNTATAVNAIRIWSGDPNTGGSSNQARAPKAWTFSGSNDGSTWVPLDEQTSEKGWSSGGSRYYQFANNTAYEYYKYDCTELNGGTDYLQIWELEFYYVNLDAPRIGATALARTGASTYDVSATETANAADLFWIADDGAAATTNLLAAGVAEGSSVTNSLSCLAANTTYQISVLATNESGTAEAVAGTLYTGELSLAKVSDGNELGCVPATLTVSRANPDPFPLVVNYSFTPGTAVAGVNYVDDAGSVTIPANATSATITVTPLIDTATTTDTSLTVSIAAGNYDAPSGVAVTIVTIPYLPELLCSSELTFPYAPTTALENFPVLVRISTTAPDGFSYEGCPDASHLWFTDDGGTTLPFEVDTWDVDGTSLVWVSVPSLSSSTAITMHWAGDTANVPDDIPASREVWTRAGYRAVWHFSGSAAESVTNLIATVNGSPTYNGNDTYPGPLGKTLWLNGSSCLSYANNSSWAKLGENATLTISCWARAIAAGYARMISSMSSWDGPSGYELTLQNSYTQITVGSSNKSQFQTNISTGPNTAWKHFTATYAGTDATLYVDGAYAKSYALNKVVTPTEALALGAESDGDNKWSGGLDEVRIRAAASTADWIAAECATMTNASYVSCSAADASIPIVATPVVTCDANGAFTVSAEISKNAPASVYCVVGGVTNAMSTTDSELPKTYSATFSGLPANMTCECIVTATSTGGSVVSGVSPTALYTGELTVAKISDANEDGQVPGSFRISRADTAHDLAVSFTVGGTAVAGQTYVALSGTATIPAGSASVDVEVVPLRDPKKVVDTTVSITLAAGLYGIGEGAELTIINTPPYSTLFACHVPITVSGYTGESTLEDFPVLVTLAADSPSGFKYADCAADGSDIRFLDENDNVYSHEIETWDTDGTSYIWVKVPSLAGKNTQFSLYYGANGVSRLPEVRAVDVWSRYAAVFHGGSTIADATGKSGVVNVNTVTGAASGGKIGGVMSKATQNATGVQFSNPVKSGAMSSATQASVSGWYKRSNSGNTVITAANVGAWGGRGFLALVEQGTYFSVAVSSTHQGASGKGALTKDVWGHLAFACDGANVSSYFNGEGIYSGSKGKTMSDPGETYWGIGSYSASGTDGFVGGMDEVRFFNGVASADWFKAEYDSVNFPATFAVLGDMRPAGVPYVNTAVVTREAGAFSVSAEILEGIPSSVAYDAEGVMGSMATSDVELPMVYSATLSGLAADTTYECYVTATSAGGVVVSNASPVVFYNGELSVEKISDASMKGLVSGFFRISRADTAHDLAVSYTVGGTAVAGQIYGALSGTAIIPAGSQFVDIPVVPILDKQVTADTTVVLTLSDGLYGINESAGSATVSIAGYKPAKPTDYAWSITATPSDAIKATLGANVYADFPVLIRLPASVSEALQAATGTDLFVRDENENALAFEVETFNPDGTTFVWVKVPSLSAATALTIYFGGPANMDNDPVAVWSRYVGVWHYAPSEAGGTTIADATGHGLGGTTTGTITTYAGPFGGDALHSTAKIKAPDYDSLLANVSQFSVCGWFKAPNYAGTSGKYHTFVSKKDNLDWNADKGWYLEMSQSKTTANLVLTASNTFTVPNATTTWNYFHLVSDGSTVKVYMNGSTSAAKSVSYTVKASAKPFMICGTDGCSDEYRIRAGTATAAETVIEYKTMADEAFFDMGAIEAVDPTEQVFAAPTVVRNANGSYTVSVVLAENNGDVGVIYDAGTASITNIIQANASPNTYTDTPANLAADTTYAFAAYGKNANDTEVVKNGGIFYNGDLSVETISNAVENGLVPGVIRISRADTAHDLAVAYTVGGTAVAGRAYEALSGTATIPAGTNSVDIQVVPFIDAQTTEDATVIVTLSAGLYGIDAQAGSAVLTIVNLVTPTGFNAWVSPSNSLASIGSNWSAGHCPTGSENVLFDGRFSTANCEWDSAASATVASWTQTNGYTGTVTVDTVFPEVGGFTCLTVSGDMDIASGKITHKAHNSTNKEDFYRLRIDVGGNLTVESGASIHATGKGAYGAHSGTGEGAYGGSYNGNLSWGSLTEPYGVGSSPAADNTYNAPAGGAIWIEVAGSTRVDGSIRSDSVSAWGQWNGYSGSGGAVYLKTRTLSGAGAISADCSNTSSGSNQNSGAGGRVSILLTDGELDSFPNANLTALAGKASYTRTGGTGTVLVRSPLKPNGVLYLRDRTNKYGMFEYRPGPSELTRIPANQTWILDEIVFGPNAILQVPTGTTLDLRGGLASISSTATALDETGLIVDGGTLLLPAAETHTISGKWIFEPQDFALAGNLVVMNGAGVGTLLLYSDTSNNVRTCGLTVSGNMHVASDSYMRAVRGGYIATGAATVGGTTPSCHGGQSAGGTANCAYDSFFHPRHPGAFGNDIGLVTVGGGAIRLSVGGTLTLDGVATATPSYPDRRSGAAGSIDITAARLEGAGRIEANGNSRNYSKDDTLYGSGGGRIAVRLTGAGETISDAWLAKINAKGCYSSNMTADYSSSAGSIYLQTAAQAEGAGTILIRNTGDTANNVAFTAIPSTKGGGEDDDFSKASLKTEAAARVKLFDNLRMVALDMASDTALDLNGKTLKVKSAKVNGVKLAPGIYTADNAAVAGFVVDSATGGALVVTGGGFSIIVR